MQIINQYRTSLECILNFLSGFNGNNVREVSIYRESLSPLSCVYEFMVIFMQDVWKSLDDAPCYCLDRQKHTNKYQFHLKKFGFKKNSKRAPFYALLTSQYSLVQREILFKDTGKAHACKVNAFHTCDHKSIILKACPPEQHRSNGGITSKLKRKQLRKYSLS